MATKTLIILSGLPYSGKTTLAAALQKERGGVVFSRDEIVEALLKDPVKQQIAKNLAAQITDPVSKNRDTKEGNALNDAQTILYVQEMVERIRASDAETIICDGTHLQRLSRLFVSEFPEYQRIAIAVKTPSATCVKRLLEQPATGFRGTLTPETIKRLEDIVEWPTTEEGFDEVVEKR